MVAGNTCMVTQHLMGVCLNPKTLGRQSMEIRQLIIDGAAP